MLLQVYFYFRSFLSRKYLYWQRTYFRYIFSGTFYPSDAVWSCPKGFWSHRIQRKNRKLYTL